MKNRVFFAIAFAIGLLVVAWVGIGFIGSSWLALVMTAVIAGVYLLGAFELSHFRAATSALAAALAQIPQPLTDVGNWLERVPASLRNPVRLRIEGERVALPGPALTPYLVGLLVMLGMLGTFLGMVVTFKGAVFALEGSTDLQAIRSALAAPIKGLGLSFGTSVAGVAASAMLGLLSAMSRRERLDVLRVLDTRSATDLRPLSLSHQRQEAFKALQLQANALPDVVERLQAMVDGMERRSQQLDAQLRGQQEQFHRGVTVAYTDLAHSVGTSLKDSLAAGARAAGESIKPVVEAAMVGIADEAQRIHQSVFDATQTQLNGVASAFHATAQSVSDGWTAALQTHSRTSENQATKLDQTLQSFADTVAERSSALLATVGAQTVAQQAAVCQTLEKTATHITEHAHQQASQTTADITRLLGQSEALVQTRIDAEAAWAQQQGARMEQLTALWRTELGALRDDEAQRGNAAVERLGALQTALASHLASVHAVAAQSQAEQATADQQRLHVWTQGLESMASTLQREWQQIGAQTLAQQNAVCLTLEKTATDITERTSHQASRTLDDIAGLLTQSEALIGTRIDAEARWTEQQGERMEQLATLWRTELGALRDDEATRGQAAVARLGELQTAMASHLATLGTALEAPMTRLMQTASDVPQAAAQVIAQLRQEMVQLTAQGNTALEERNALVEKITMLLQGLNQASGEQRAATEALVASATAVLGQAGNQFAQALEAQAGKAADVAAHVSGSAVELASLGESFGHGVQLFSASNTKLLESLERIEGAIQQSTARSDEQLAYYVAQAREVIDLSITSQQGLVEELRRRDAKSTVKALAKAEA